ncbi:MAG: glutathione synthase [Alphaproteobacteria bacterium]
MAHSKALNVAIQMDPMEHVDIDGDSTFRLALEAQARGHSLFLYHPNDLTLRDGTVTARGRSAKVQRVKGDHVAFGAEEVIDLASTDVVLLRQDPPFDMGYITTTHLLEKVHPHTLVVNDPAEVRNAPEKLYVMGFDGVMPPTLITRDPAEVKAFRDEFQDIIIKPLYGNGGAGVFRLKPGDENLNSLIEMFTETAREPFIVQAYLKDVRAGDKRIILVDGVPVGAINRVPAEGEARSNMHVGGRAEKVELTKRDQEICEIIGADLKARGLIFVGIDVIGDYMTEINVTSPTGIQELERFDGTNAAAAIWDAVESKK